MSLELQFQRDLNRVLDSDRNTRKKGLQNILESLPWTSKKNREGLLNYLFQSVLKVILPCISDAVEKCREFSLKILKQLTLIWKQVDYELLVELTNKLTERVNDLPFPEQAEELRLLIAELFFKLVEKDCEMKIVYNNFNDSRIVTKIASILPKFLTDNFPQVKRALGELTTLLVDMNRSFVKPYIGNILKALEANASHQHAKTRSMSIQAIARSVCCLDPTRYEKILNETVLPLFKKLLSDRTSSVKLELCDVIQYILNQRIVFSQERSQSFLLVDFQLIVILLILHGDEVEEIAGRGKKALTQGLRHWKPDLLPLAIANETEGNKLTITEEIEDAEVAMQEISISIHSTTDEEPNKATPPLTTEELSQFLITYLSPILSFILDGTDHWTNESKIMYISSLKVFVQYIHNSINQYELLFHQMLYVLYYHIRSDDHDVRIVVENCVRVIGCYASFDKILDLSLPIIIGLSSIPSSSSASSIPLVSSDGGVESTGQRAGAIRVLTEVLKGYRLKLSNAASPPSEEELKQFPSQLESIVLRLASPSMLSVRDVSLREALLLFLRALIDSFPTEIKESITLQEYLSILFIYLRAKCPYEQDSVSDITERELLKLSKLIVPSAIGGNEIVDGKEIINRFLSQHYLFVLHQILFNEIVPRENALQALKSRLIEQQELPQWEHLSPQKASFEALLNDCPHQAWVFIDLLLPILHRYIKPKELPPTGTTEANMLSYASQRGEEKIPTIEEIDIRLNFIVLLENLIRYTSTHWESSQYLSKSCERIMKDMIIPNLIWRVGRVEGTIRKISLAVCYHILKSGSVPFETLARLAGELVPLLISHLDDTEVSIRLMTVLSLTVIFDRLPRLFAEQSVNDLYPKLISRLDDFSDEIRIGICLTLEKFFQCGVNERCYHNTMLDYILTQLFIHLDDLNENLQLSIAKLIIFIGQLFHKEQKEIILQKAEINRNSHRTPKYCQMIIFELKGIEILHE